MGLIEADKLIEICRKGWKLFGGEDEKLKHWVDEADIRNQPTVDAEPVRHGHWVRNDNGTYSCSECHSWIHNEQHYYARYCLFCGAKMTKEKENE